MIDTNSKYYPYQKVQENFADLSQMAYLPKKICDYLIDAPKGTYKPKDDNSYPRCRFWKYLYYDEARPLSFPLPTIQQKMSVVFNPDKASEPPTDKDYRLIPQEWVQQEQEKAMTRIYCYLGRTIAPHDDNIFSVAVIFDIFTHSTYELNTKDKVYSRTGAILTSLIDALNGVNMEGVGTFTMSKRVHPDCCTRSIFDGNTNVGKELVIALQLPTTVEQKIGDFSNMPIIDKNIKLV